MSFSQRGGISLVYYIFYIYIYEQKKKNKQSAF